MAVHEVSDLNPLSVQQMVVVWRITQGFFEESVLFYERASGQFSPGFILNYLELAKAYDKINEPSEGD